MFFIVIMELIHFLYHRVVFPVITTLYFYEMLMVWLFISGCLTYLFMYRVDSFRMQYISKKLLLEVLKAALVTMALAIAIIGLYDLSLYFTVTSDFFRTQKSSMVRLGAFGVDYLYGKTIGQSWEVIKLIVSALFFIMVPVMTTKFVTEVAYHLQDHKTWWKFYFLMGLSSVCSFGLMLYFHFIF